jgi:hypothetical protein
MNIFKIVPRKGIAAGAVVVLSAIWIGAQIHGTKTPPSLDQAIVTAFGVLFASDVKKRKEETDEKTPD